MKIAIEAQRIFRGDKHGMDFVILEVLRELQRLDTANQYFVFVAPGPDRCLSSTSNMQVLELCYPTYPLWEQLALPRAVRRVEADLLHCTSNTAPMHCPVPLIVTLHDIISLEPRQHRSSSLYQEMGWHYRKLVVPRILKKCRHVITVSRFEQRRICQTLQLPPSLVTAVYNGYNTRFRKLQSPDMQVLHRLMPAYEPDKGYIFFLGNTDPKKNTARVLQASLGSGKSVSPPSSPICISPVIFPTPICQRSITPLSLSFIRLCGKVSASPSSKRWPAARPSSPAALPLCPKWLAKVPCWSTQVNHKILPILCYGWRRTKSCKSNR